MPKGEGKVINEAGFAKKDLIPQEKKKQKKKKVGGGEEAAHSQ